MHSQCKTQGSDKTRENMLKLKLSLAKSMSDRKQSRNLAVAKT